MKKQLIKAETENHKILSPRSKLCYKGLRFKDAVRTGLEPYPNLIQIQCITKGYSKTPTNSQLISFYFAKM